MTPDSSLVAALAPQLPVLSWGSTEGPKITRVLPDGTACPCPFTSTNSPCLVQGQEVLSVAPRPLGDPGDPQCQGGTHRCQAERGHQVVCGGHGAGASTGVGPVPAPCTRSWARWPYMVWGTGRHVEGSLQDGVIGVLHGSDSTARC